MNNNEFNYLTAIGLENICESFYIDVISQCFCHIKEFVNFFKFNLQINSIEKDKNILSYSFKVLIGNIWQNKNNLTINNNYFLQEFKQNLPKIYPLFKGDATSDDIKYFVNFIIMILHSELNKANK